MGLDGNDEVEEELEDDVVDDEDGEEEFTELAQQTPGRRRRTEVNRIYLRIERDANKQWWW